MSNLLRVYDFGSRLVNYEVALKLQDALFNQRKLGNVPDTMVVLQHEAVITLGKRGSLNDLKADEQTLKEAGIQLYSVPRGGEATYHGPGQVVCYPIVSLREVGKGARVFVESLEDTMINTLKDQFNLDARGRLKGATGVWVGDSKIGAIGVKISSGITTHGLSLNVAPDLNHYQYLIPCGQLDKDVTSISKEIGRQVSIKEVTSGLVQNFGKLMGYQDIQHLEMEQR